MEFDPMLPIWVQVAMRLQGDMVSGQLKPGDKLPSTRELALRFTINPNTAARVYGELESAGLCETRRGLGTYVTRDTARVEALRTELAERLVGDFLRHMRALSLTREDALHYIQEYKED